DGSSNTSVCRGTDGLISGSFELRVRVIREKNGDWSVLVDPSGSQNYQLEASGNDNTYKSTSWFGFFCNYTTSNADNFYFDDIQIKHYTPDVTAPSIVNLTVLNAQELLLEFNETVTATSAENTTNYMVNNGIGVPASATRDAANPRKVTLSFNNPFSSGQQYNLNIQNVSDVAGNMMQATETFSYYKARMGDLVINEIMADPSPQVGLPDAEYLELYNRSQHPISLNNWKIQIGSSTKYLDAITIKTDSFLILCADDDTNLLKPFGDVYEFSSFSLTNGGTSLSLKNEDQQVIHHVNYSDSWYKDDLKDDGGWSLEQMDAANFCGGASNWLASDTITGGTPGAQNSVANTNPDIYPPQIQNVSILDSMNLEVRFSETIDSVRLKKADYTVNNGIGTAQIEDAGAPDYKNVHLQLPQILQPNVLYELQINDTISDCAGNNSTGLSFQFSLFNAEFQDVIISEIMCKPSDQKGLPEVEYVELYNRSDFPVDLRGWNFSYSGNTPKRISSQVILPDSCLIICDDDDFVHMQQFGDVATISSLSLPNNGTDLLLVDSLSRVISFVEYSDEWYQNDFKQSSGGWSLEMIDMDYPCVGYDNWRASKSPEGGTPGASNSVSASNPDVHEPEYISMMYVNPSMFIIEMDEPLNPAQIPPASAFEVQGMGNVLSVQAIEPAYNRLQLILPSPLQPDSIYHLLIKDSLKDCAGNQLNKSSLPLAVPSLPEPGDIVFNEVLFESPDATDDFVELINRSGKTLYLYNINLVYMDADDPLKISEVELDAGKRLLLDGEIRCFTEKRRALDEYYKRSVRNNIFQNGYLPSLPSDYGILMLRSSFDGTVIDSMRYDQEMHSGMLKETKGISLERITPQLPTTQRENWTSAAETAGYATPGFVNSQYNKISKQNSGKVSLEHKMFTPNGDGDRDVLIINYHMDQPGYVGNVRIYDRNGRETRELHNNVLMEMEGSFIWDGVANNAAKAPVGIYLIYVEVFDTNGNHEKYKMTAILGGRLE
ncbi:MAG: lamin tail domain-containing protein, partial [Bacteroidales bacterium]|nr:lamin tail domain-containing protein [Bacteroidales bacterium]